MFNKKVWIEGEILAQKYLKNQGYKILDTNVSLSNAEIDIIALASRKLLLKKLKSEYKSGELLECSYKACANNLADTIVFIEVKARSNADFGLPQEAVTLKKQQHIRRAAQTYIAQNKLDNMAIRYDIIAVLNGEIEHLENAF